MILAYPILVLLGPAIFYTYFYFKTFWRKSWIQKASALVFCLVPIIFGLLMDICWSPMALIGLPVYFICMQFEKCRRDVRGRREAMQRIQNIIESNNALV